MFTSFFTYPITFVLLAVAATHADDGTKYSCEIGGNVNACEANDNYKVVCDLKMKNNGDHVVLEGSININGEMDDSDEMKIDIVKELDNGRSDPVFSVVSSICSAMKEKDTPWYPVFEMMGLESCPIKAGEYKIDALRFDMDSMSSFLNHEYVGEYGCELKTTQKADTTSCHKLNVAIVESDE